MKKNGILTLLFACIPGAGQMYQGYMKRGLSLITMFCLFIIVGSATGLDALVVGCIVVYMYSFFDTFNLRAQIIAENAPADDYLVHINWKDKRMQDFMMDSHKLLGWGLIALGAMVAYQNIIMYCVMMLSTICVVVITCGGPFLLGLVVFYLSAGFFSIYFASSFMRLSYAMKEGKLWAGLGRAVNNLCAVGTASMSLTLLHSPSYVTIVIALVLFAITSVLIFVYQRSGDQMRWKQENAILSQEAQKTEKILETHKKNEKKWLALFAEKFS